jgi:hypothetical protein
MISPDIDDYIAFFEATPRILNPADGWSCGAEFISTRGADSIMAVISPDKGRILFQWSRDGELLIDLILDGAIEWLIEKDNGIERLVLKFHDPGIAFFLLQLRPRIKVIGETNWA